MLTRQQYFPLRYWRICPDCNVNDVPDECDIAAGTSPDDDFSGIPDECEGPVLYVDHRATGYRSGANWEHAMHHLQDALLVASQPGNTISEIRIAQGVYRPDHGGLQTPGTREATFQLLSGVTLRGGYAGSLGPDPDERDVALYETIVESADGASDGFAGSEASRDFMARLRIGIMADAAPISNAGDGPPIDLVFFS